MRSVITRVLALSVVGMSSAMAQTLTIGDVTVVASATSVQVPITYTAGGGVDSYQLDFTIVRGGASPIHPTNNVTTVNADGTCSGNAISAGGVALRATDIDLGGGALLSGTTCTLTFPLDAGNLAVGDTVALGPGTVEFVVAGNPIAGGTVDPGSITVVAGPATGPVVTYTPAPAAAPTTISFAAAGSIGGSTTSQIALAIDGANPGANGGQTVLDVSTCTTGNPNVTVQAADVTCTAGGSCTDGTDNDADLTCVSTTAAQTGTITCNEVRDNETAPGDNIVVTTPRSWGFTCPAANVNPTITPTPANGGTLNTSVVGQGQTSTGTFSFSGSGGSGTGSSQVTGCSATAGFTLVPANPTLTFTGTNGAAQTFNVTCVAGAAAQNGTVSCTVGGAAYTANVTCPAGLPVAAPIMTANPAEDADDTSDATAEVTFAAPLGLAGNSTSTINLDVSGGIDDATGTAETVSITGCAISNNATSNITITAAPAATAFGTNDPVGDVDTSIGLRCGGNAAATTALLTCTVNSVANGTTTPDTRIWDIACPAAVTAPEIATNPASPGTFNVQGQPGNVVAAQVDFTNSGDAPLTITGCVAAPDDAGITFTPPASPIAINGGTSALVFSCTAPGLNQTITETVSCTTNDADEGTVSFTLNCTGANLLPIPAVNGLGKALLAALIIGLGLIGLGLRRQTV